VIKKSEDARKKKRNIGGKDAHKEEKKKFSDHPVKRKKNTPFRDSWSDVRFAEPSRQKGSPVLISEREIEKKKAGEAGRGGEKKRRDPLKEKKGVGATYG